MVCRVYDKLDNQQLEQCWTPTWDGDLISKTSRDKLVEGGLVQRAHGFNWLTADGIISLQLTWLAQKNPQCRL
jgi:hypothetical protein